MPRNWAAMFPKDLKRLRDEEGRILVDVLVSANVGSHPRGRAVVTINQNLQETLGASGVRAELLDTRECGSDLLLHEAAQRGRWRR